MEDWLTPEIEIFIIENCLKLSSKELAERINEMIGIPKAVGRTTVMQVQAQYKRELEHKNNIAIEKVLSRQISELDQEIPLILKDYIKNIKEFEKIVHEALIKIDVTKYPADIYKVSKLMEIYNNIVMDVNKLVHDVNKNKKNIELSIDTDANKVETWLDIIHRDIESHKAIDKREKKNE